MSYVLLASRAQPVSGFPAGLELWMFELWLGVLRETLGGQRACLRKVACVRVDIRGLRSSELGKVSAFSLPPLFFFLILLLSQKVCGSGLHARASARYTEHVFGRTLKGTVRREGCCGRCSRVDVQVSCIGRGASPATMPKKKKKKKPNEQVRRTGVSLSVRRRRGRLLSRTWLCDAPPKGSKLGGWGRGIRIKVYLCNEVCRRGFEVNLGRGTLGWGMLEGQGKFRGRSPVSQYLWSVLVYGLGVVFWHTCRVDGRWNTWARTALVFGRERDVEPLPFFPARENDDPLYIGLFPRVTCEVKHLSVYVRMRCHRSSMFFYLCMWMVCKWPCRYMVVGDRVCL